MGTHSHTRISSMIKLLTFLIASSSASFLPLRLQFGNHNPSLRGVKMCAGHEDDIMTVLEGTTEDTICMPGTTEMNIHTMIKENLPEDLMMSMDLNKLTPFPMHVPCLNGVGSCDYALCPMIVDMGDQICPSFPPGQSCGCPLLAGEMNLEGIQLPVQDMGPILGAVMEGDYTATITMFGESNKDMILSCVEFTFSLELCP